MASGIFFSKNRFTGFFQSAMKKKYLYLLIAIITCSVILVRAQSSHRPPERMKLLSAFNGEWKGEMAEMKNGKKIKTKISHQSMKVAGGWGVQVTETASIPNEEKYQSVRVFSYSPGGDYTYMYVVDNRGETFFYTGNWTGNKTLILKCAFENNSRQTIKKEVQYQFKTLREYDYKYITSVGDSIDKIIEMNMKKE